MGNDKCFGSFYEKGTEMFGPQRELENQEKNGACIFKYWPAKHLDKTDRACCNEVTEQEVVMGYFEIIRERDLNISNEKGIEKGMDVQMVLLITYFLKEIY